MATTPPVSGGPAGAGPQAMPGAADSAGAAPNSANARRSGPAPAGERSRPGDEPEARNRASQGAAAKIAGWVVAALDRIPRYALRASPAIRRFSTRSAAHEEFSNRLSGVAPEIKSQIIADAVSYAIKHFPDATKHFSVEQPEQLADLAAVLLPKIEAEQTTARTPAGGVVA